MKATTVLAHEAPGLLGSLQIFDNDRDVNDLHDGPPGRPSRPWRTVRVRLPTGGLTCPTNP